MTLHHSKHHQAYVMNLNSALKSHIAAVNAGDIAAQIALQGSIKFNGGGHINHALFWANLAPAGTPEASPEAAPQFVIQIQKTWGGAAEFQRAFATALMAIQGSGWGWLVRDGASGGLRIVTTRDQDPVGPSDVPLLGVDMWEHAYYLQYLNGKAAYLENIWKVINWKTVEERFLGQREDVFKGLRAVI